MNSGLGYSLFKLIGGSGIKKIIIYAHINGFENYNFPRASKLDMNNALVEHYHKLNALYNPMNIS